jgi:hypothetical protein
VEPFEFTSNGGRGSALSRRVKSPKRTFHEVIKDGMSKTSSVIQIVFFLLLIGYSTYSLFKGDFEQAILPFPILALYYVFVVSRHGAHSEDDSDPDETDQGN